MRIFFAARGVSVVYVPYTQGVSSTLLREKISGGKNLNGTCLKKKVDITFVEYRVEKLL